MTQLSSKELEAVLILSRLKIDGRRRAISLLLEGKTACESTAVLEAEGKSGGFREILAILLNRTGCDFRC